MILPLLDINIFMMGGGLLEKGAMNINDPVYVKTDGQERREGTILLIEPFNEGVMYLVSLPEYPEGIWFFNEKEGNEGLFVTPVER